MWMFGVETLAFIMALNVTILNPMRRHRVYRSRFDFRGIGWQKARPAGHRKTAPSHRRPWTRNSPEP